MADQVLESSGVPASDEIPGREGNSLTDSKGNFTGTSQDLYDATVVLQSRLSIGLGELKEMKTIVFFGFVVLLLMVALFLLEMGYQMIASYDSMQDSAIRLQERLPAQ